MIDPSGHRVELDLGEPDEGVDELELVYRDLQAAQEEIARLKAEIEVLRSEHLSQTRELVGRE